MEKSSEYLAAELARKTRLMIWREHGEITEILKNIPRRPDFILLNDFHPDYCPFVRGFSRCAIPVGQLMHDIHYKPERRRYWMEKEKIDYFFPVYRQLFYEIFPEYRQRMFWLPHHVPEHIFQDAGLPRTIDVLMSGAMIPRLYPLRCHMLNVLKGRPGFVHLPHPGVTACHQAVVGKRYARMLGRAKVVLTCASRYNLPLLKYFETLAVKTLLLAPATKELEDLGFIDGKTFVAVDKSNFAEKVEYFLQNEKKARNIAENGYKLVQKKHTTAVRANELVQFIAKVVGHSGVVSKMEEEHAESQ